MFLDKMSDWKFNLNKLYFESQIHIDNLDLFKDYLFHRFRILFSQFKKLILPTHWKFKNNRLTLTYKNSMNIILNSNNFKNRLIELNENKNDFLIALKTMAEFHKQKIARLSQFLPIKGKWIPPVSFFTRSVPNEILEKELEADVNFISRGIDSLIETSQREGDKESIGLFNILRDHLNKRDYSALIKTIQNLRIEENSSFLDILTEAEFFSQIRQIYRYRKMSKDEVSFNRTIQKNEELLEIDLYYKDYQFGKIKRPSVQELWDALMDNSHVTRLLVCSDLKNPPNPLRILRENEITIEWIDVHADQQIIVVKTHGRYLPKRGFFYVYEFGDIDQIQKKRRFINFVKNHPFLEKYLNSMIITKTDNFRNIYSREDLAKIICENWGIFAVQGPPGTGKTFLATEVISKFLKINPYAKILVCSKEHLALNYILRKIIERLNKENIEFRAFRSLSYMRQMTSTIDKDIKDYLSSNIMREIGSYKWDPESEVWYHAQESLIQEYDLRNLSLALNSASIIFCTTMDGIFYHLIDNRSFDLVVIEEAGKCYPSELLHVICLGQKVLLIGDQNQLPPYQIQETEEALKIWEKVLLRAKSDHSLDNDLLKRFGYDYLKLKRFYNNTHKFNPQQLNWLKPFETLFNRLPPKKKYILDHQYRMERPLSNVIGRVFYNREFEHKKKTENPLKGVIPKEYDIPMLWIDTPHMVEYMEATEDPEKVGMRINFYELSILLTYLRLLKPIKKIDLVILTPYNDQKDLFLDSKELKEVCSELSERPFVEIIRTTDEYQGHEANLTILSLVRNNTLYAASSWGFIIEPERLNVMFSRTRSRQVVIGCSQHIIRNSHEKKIEIFYKLYLEYKKEGIFINSQEFLEKCKVNVEKTKGG